MQYDNIDIEITSNTAESEQHIAADLKIVTDAGLKNIIMEKFIPWLLDPDFLDKDKEKVYEGLKLYEITYHYSKIVAIYSPTKQDNFFGQFEFCFESGNEYTKDIFQAVAMKVYILNGEIVKVSGYDI